MGNKILYPKDRILKSHFKLYIIILIIFIVLLTWLLYYEYAMTLLVILAFGVWYISIITYESKRLVSYISENNKELWNLLRVSPLSNPFKWMTILNTTGDDSNEVQQLKQHYQRLIIVHILHILTFLIVPIFLNILSTIIN